MRVRLAGTFAQGLLALALLSPSTQSWTPRHKSSSRGLLQAIGFSQALRLSHLEDFEESEEPESSEEIPFHNAANTRISPESQLRYNQLVRNTLSMHGLELRKIEWFADRIEVTASKLSPSTSRDGASEDDEFPNADMLEQAHKSLYAALESSDASLVEDYELIVASPGIEDVLKSPRDFVTFQGFPVIVSLSQEFRKKMTFEGSLQERTEEHVVISIKGRILKIPLDLVDRVELPKPKFEPNDPEIRKLR